MSPFRISVLGKIDPYAQPIPERPYVAYVWPTEACSIGCAHCNFGSRPNSRDGSVLRDRAEDTVRWCFEAGVQRFVACGGGEPLDEPDFVLRALAACARSGLRFDIYTSGASLTTGAGAASYVRSWREAWTNRVRADHCVSVRLSVDRFHEERIGLAPLIDWIQAVEGLAPDWLLAIRGIRAVGDDSIDRLAKSLGGSLVPIRDWSSWMVLPSGRKILVERKGFVLEGRGRLSVLRKKGLALTALDQGIVDGLNSSNANPTEFGRPLSSRLPVTHRRLDLEIHADAEVHVLESQAADLRMSLLESDWTSIRGRYYRDPVLHTVVGRGLEGVSELIRAARSRGVAPGGVVPYSIERLTDERTLDWVTASAILQNQAEFVYNEAVIAEARALLLGPIPDP